MFAGNPVISPMMVIHHLSTHPHEFLELSHSIWTTIKSTRSFAAWKNATIPVHVLRSFQTPLLRAVRKINQKRSSTFNLRELIEEATMLTSAHPIDRIGIQVSTLMSCYEKLVANMKEGIVWKLGALMTSIAVLMLQDEVGCQVLARWKQDIVKLSALVSERYLKALEMAFQDFPILEREEPQPMELDLDGSTASSISRSTSPSFTSLSPSSPKDHSSPTPSSPSSDSHYIATLPDSPVKWQCQMMNAYLSHTSLDVIRIAGDHIFDKKDMDMVAMLVSLAVEDLVAEGYLENNNEPKQERTKLERLAPEAYAKLKQVFDDLNGELVQGMAAHLARELGIAEERVHKYFFCRSKNLRKNKSTSTETMPTDAPSTSQQ